MNVGGDIDCAAAIFGRQIPMQAIRAAIAAIVANRQRSTPVPEAMRSAADRPQREGPLSPPAHLPAIRVMISQAKLPVRDRRIKSRIELHELLACPVVEIDGIARRRRIAAIANQLNLA